MYKRFVLAPLLALLFATVALASVFVYYPLSITATPTGPGVVFASGSNANQPDIGTGNQITVFIGSNQTFASITIHPTYQENYYKDVLNITNGDDNAMKVYLVFTSATSNLPAGSVVKLFFYEGTTKVTDLNITNPSLNNLYEVGQISAGDTWQIDIYVSIPEGKSIDDVSYSATANLVYTPSSETPPANPSGGR